MLHQHHHRGRVRLRVPQPAHRVQHVSAHLPPAVRLRKLRRLHRQPVVRHRSREIRPGDRAPLIPVIKHLAHHDLVVVQHVDQPANMVGIRVRDDHHLQLVDLVLLQKRHHRRPRRLPPTVDQHVKAARVPQQDRVPLPHVDVGDVHRPGRDRPHGGDQNQRRNDRQAEEGAEVDFLTAH